MALAGVLNARPPAPRPPGRRRLGSSAALSTLLHLALLAAAIWFAHRQTEAPHWLPPPSVRMVFAGGGKGKTAVPNKAPAARHRPASPPPLPAAPPTAPAAASAPPVPRVAPSPRVAPAPPAAAPAQRPAHPPPPAPAPALRRALPLPPPTPAHPAPARLVPPHPAPSHPARPALRFPAPTGFSLGAPRATPPRARASAPARPSRGIDLSFAPDAAGGHRFNLNGLLDRDGVGPDWSNAFRAWLDRHSYYPHDAAMFGEHGSVVVDFVVDKHGAVSGLRLEESSGHPILDMAVLAMFRNATLPALPPQNGARLPVRFTMHYVLR